ncbi:MAG: TonB-dependent receptor [Proteobacteria bacterium]|nr:TonB-dependent receptor [Pseudomonadota bacterium]
MRGARNGRCWGMALAGVTGLIGGPGYAQDASGATATAIPEIVVTAQKFEQNIQDTPISVSVVSGTEIQKEGRTKLDEVLVNAPGVQVQGVARGFMVSIRGLGLNLPPQNGAGAVATNFDGIYNSRGEAASTGFYDLERVETLNGPQSTIYGRNAVGGVVNVISRNPVLGKFEGYVQGEGGNYSSWRGEGAVNVPLGEALALRISGAAVARDGYISNGRDDNKASSFRAKLLFNPNPGVSALVGFEQTTLRGKGPGAIPDSSFAADSRFTSDPPDGFQHHVARKYWADLEFDAGPGKFILLPSYQTLHGIVQGSFGGNFAYNYDPLYTDQFAVEARYASKPEATVPWTGGYYHYHNNGTGPFNISGSCYAYSPTGGPGTNTVYIPPPGYSNAAAGPPGSPCATTAYQTDFGVDVRTVNVDSVFGQVTIPLGSALHLTLGGRESWVKTGGTTDLNNNNTAGATGAPVTVPDIVKLADVRTNYFDYKATIEAKIAAQSLVYATIASGHREGGYGFASPFSAPEAYAPENMVDYEAGIKNTLLNGTLLLNAAVFYYDYKSYQLVYVVFPNPPSFLTFPGHELGAEGSAAYALTRADKLTGSLVYLDSKITGASLYAGAPFTNSPRWSFKASYEHDFDLGAAGRIWLRGDFRTLSSQLVFPVFASQVQGSPAVMGSYSTGDALVGWTSDSTRYSVTGFVKNVNDKLIKTSEFFGYAQVQAPRTYGLTASMKF